MLLHYTKDRAKEEGRDLLQRVYPLVKYTQASSAGS